MEKSNLPLTNISIKPTDFPPVILCFNTFIFYHKVYNIVDFLEPCPAHVVTVIRIQRQGTLVLVLSPQILAFDSLVCCANN